MSQTLRLALGALMVALWSATCGPMSAMPNLRKSLYGATGDPWRVIAISDAAPSSAQDGSMSVIRFAGGFVLRTGLYRASVLGRLSPPGHAPFIIVGGFACTECDANNHSIYIAQATAWPRRIDASGRDSWFSQYPHRNYEAARKILWDWSRLFIGHCLSRSQATIVTFREDRSAKAPQRDVKWASVADGRLVVHAAETGAPFAPSLRAVRQAVEQGRCREVRQETFDEPF